MQRPTSDHTSVPRLAEAFLALGDDAGETVRTPPSPAVLLATLAATLVIGLSAPLAWATAPAPKPSDQPSATTASKAALPAPDDDGGDGAM